MKPVEALFFWLTTMLYVEAFVVALFQLIVRRTGIGRGVWAFIFAGLASNTVLVGLRWVLSGHLPVGNRYELNISGAWIAVVVVLVATGAVPRMRPLVAGALPPILLALGLGITSQRGIEPLSSAYDSPWLVVHIIFAFLAFGCFILAFGAGVFYLLEDMGICYPLSEALPALPELEAFAYRMIAFGFILEAVMIMTGSVWANKLWGSYWSWDPIETWSLISLLVYALYLHLYSFAGWRGRRSMVLAVVGLLFVIVSFWGVQLVVPTVHNFNRF